MNDVGYVYFAAPKAEMVAIKIGWSLDPLVAVRNGGSRWTWFGLRVLGTFSCSVLSPLAGTGRGSLEYRLHVALKPHRIRGEWFRPHPDVLAFVRIAQLGCKAEQAANYTIAMTQELAVAG